MQSQVFQSKKKKKKVKMAKPHSMQNFHHKKCFRQNIAYGKNVFGEKNLFFFLKNSVYITSQGLHADINTQDLEK